MWCYARSEDLFRPCHDQRANFLLSGATSMVTREHYVPNIREYVREILKPEIHDFELRLQEVEKNCSVQREAIHLLLSLLLSLQADRETVQQRLREVPNPYSEFDIKNGHFEKARELLAEQLEQLNQT